jgi:hypothetical protein
MELALLKDKFEEMGEEAGGLVAGRGQGNKKKKQGGEAGTNIFRYIIRNKLASFERLWVSEGKYDRI